MTNTAKTQNTSTPTLFIIKKENKMEKCKAIFYEVYTEGYVPQHKPDSQVAECIVRFMKEANLTSEASARTYHRNLMQEAQGKSRYWKKSSAKTTAERVQDQTPTPATTPKKARVVKATPATA